MRWVAVSERLPPQGEVVLICHRLPSSGATRFGAGWCDASGRWFDADHWRIEVTYWCPIPPLLVALPADVPAGVSSSERMRLIANRPGAASAGDHESANP